MPLFLAIYDCWHEQRRGPNADNVLESSGDSVDPRFGFVGRGRYLVSAFCLAFANALQSSALVASRSTYICPLSSLTRANTLLVQSLAVLIDSYILLSTHKIFNSPGLVRTAEDGTALAALGHIFIVSSITDFEPQDIRH